MWMPKCALNIGGARMKKKQAAATAAMNEFELASAIERAPRALAILWMNEGRA